MSAEPITDDEYEELPTGPRLTVTELRPFAPASGAFLNGRTELDGRSLQISFGVGDPDGLWSQEALDAYFNGLDALPRGVPLRMLGRLTRSRENGRPRLRVRRITDPDGTILWHDIPAGSVQVAGTLPPRKPYDRIASILGRVGVGRPMPESFRADAFTHDATLLDRLEAIDTDGTPFGHSLTIFELDGGRATLSEVQAAVAAGTVWIKAGDRQINGHDDFDGVALYDGDRRIGYAFE